MAEITGIQWTDSTFNPWWGCTKVAPGCDNCYAAALDARTGGDYWVNSPRQMSVQNWNKPIRWNREAEANMVRHKVFCGSMCDWTDNKAPVGQLDRLWDLIRVTPMLDWQLLTKRAPNIRKSLPDDWGDGYKNVWLGVTVENRAHGLPRIEHLRELPAKVRFLSIEPLLEDIGDLDLTGINWVIVGGESGPRARKMEATWAERIVAQCREQEIPIFFKQWGGRSANKGGCQIGGTEIKQLPIHSHKHTQSQCIHEC
jgi:protein gp37